MLRSALVRSSALSGIARPHHASRLVAARALSSTASSHPSVTRPGEPPLEPGIVEKFQLTSPSRFVPLSLGAAGLLSATGLYHFNAETQILGLFILFTGTIYAKGGDTIGKMLDEVGDQILKEHNALEDAQIASAKLAIQALERQAEVYDDIKRITDGLSHLESLIVETGVRRVQVDIRRLYVTLLDYLVAREERDLVSAHRKLVVDATKQVRDAFSSRAELKQQALAQAIAALKNPTKPSAGEENLVGKLFADVLAKERAKAEANPETFEALDWKKLPDDLKTILRREGFGHILDELSRSDDI